LEYVVSRLIYCVSYSDSKGATSLGTPSHHHTAWGKKGAAASAAAGGGAAVDPTLTAAEWAAEEERLDRQWYAELFSFRYFLNFYAELAGTWARILKTTKTITHFWPRKHTHDERKPL
jgi:hypothetical protein